MSDAPLIRIHYADDDEQARKRQAHIIERLDHFGAAQVRAMIGHGFPTNWDPIIAAWLKGQP